MVYRLRWSAWMLMLVASLSALAWADGEGTLHLKVTLQGRTQSAKVTVQTADGAVVDTQTAASGADVALKVPMNKPLVVLVKADGYDDYKMSTTLTADSASQNVTMKLQPRVTISAPAGTKVLLNGKSLGTTQSGQDFVIKPPTLAVDHKYQLTLRGSSGVKTVQFTALAGNGHVLYGPPSSRKGRGISIGSKDYQIYPPPK